MTGSTELAVERDKLERSEQFAVFVALESECKITELEMVPGTAVADRTAFVAADDKSSDQPSQNRCCSSMIHPSEMEYSFELDSKLVAAVATDKLKINKNIY